MEALREGRDVAATATPEHAPTPTALRHAGRQKSALHEIVIVGGGAGGLELATRLGDTLGRRARARVTLVERERTHFWKPLPARDRRRQHGSRLSTSSTTSRRRTGTISASASGEMEGLDRTRRDGQGRAVRDEDGDEVIRCARVPLRHAGHRGRQSHQRFRHAGRAASTRSPSTRRSRPSASIAGWSTPASAPTRSASRCGPSSCAWSSSAPARPAWSSPPSCTRRRASSVAYGLDRIDPEKDVQAHARRGRAAHPARRCRNGCPTARRDLLAELERPGAARGERVDAGRRGRRAAASGEAIPAELDVWAAGIKAADVPAGHRRAGDQPHQPARRAADAADDARRATSSRSATAPPARGRHAAAAFRRARRPRTSRRRTSCGRSGAGSPASRCSRGAIATSARWFRSASTRPSAR